MDSIKITRFHNPDLEQILASEETLLWSGKPAYGRRLFQAVGDERVYHVSFLIGIAIMWITFPFIETDQNMAFWFFSIMTFMFTIFSFYLAHMRHYVLCNLVYMITNKRSIILRRGPNWRFKTCLYVISCPHSETYPYSIIPSRPYPSLQIATMLSWDQVQPFGLGLSHPGQPFLWGRSSAPVVFEYVPNAQELLRMIQSHANAQNKA